MATFGHTTSKPSYIVGTVLDAQAKQLDSATSTCLTFVEALDLLPLRETDQGKEEGLESQLQRSYQKDDQQENRKGCSVSLSAF